jgi:hypothetical protein
MTQEKLATPIIYSSEENRARQIASDICGDGFMFLFMRMLPPPCNGKQASSSMKKG